MRGPTDEFRGELQAMLEGMAAPVGEFGVRVVTSDVEVELDGILQLIESGIEGDVASDPEPADPTESLEAIESWLSVASYAFASVYAPQSPLPIGLVGVGKEIMRRMRRIAAACSDPAGAAARSLRATGYSIGVGFPWECLFPSAGMHSDLRLHGSVGGTDTPSFPGSRPFVCAL